MLSQKVPEVSQAFEALKVISREPQTRREFEIREKALHDKASIQQWYTDKGIGIGREEGRKEGKIEGKIEGEKTGIIKGKIETAKQMYKLNLPEDVIQKATGLSKEELKKI